MSVRCVGILLCLVFITGALATAQGPQSSSSKHTKSSSSARLVPNVDAGTISNGVYRNRVLALSCKIPAGWVLRTEEMNAREENESSETSPEKNPHFSQSQGEVGHPPENKSSVDDSSIERTPKPTEGSGRVLLAAFSRPPAASGEDVNASIVIAAESVASYPGLKEAAQYFGPLTEVARAQGFTVDEEPYEMEIGAKVVVRGDFHRDVATRVMRQSTLAFLAQGYAVSITVIGGTVDEVEELIDGVSFGGGK